MPNFEANANLVNSMKSPIAGIVSAPFWEEFAAMRHVFPKTPLMRNALLSAKYDAEVWLKREDLSPVRSYKLRGAFNAMRKVIPDRDLFVCASAGNHARQNACT